MPIGLGRHRYISGRIESEERIQEAELKRPNQRKGEGDLREHGSDATIGSYSKIAKATIAKEPWEYAN